MTRLGRKNRSPHFLGGCCEIPCNLNMDVESLHVHICTAALNLVLVSESLPFFWVWEGGLGGAQPEKMSSWSWMTSAGTDACS